MDLIKRDGRYYLVTPVAEGFDIEREIGRLQDEIRDRQLELKELLRLKDK